MLNPLFVRAASVFPSFRPQSMLNIRIQLFVYLKPDSLAAAYAIEIILIRLVIRVITWSHFMK